MALLTRLRSSLAHAWNAFTSDPYASNQNHGGFNYGGRPDRQRMAIGNERSIIASIITRIAIDVSEVPIRHVRVDDEERYVEDIKSGLNDCLKVEANIDQAGRQFRQDIAQTVLEKGVVAIVPVETSVNPTTSGGFDIKSLRVGEIIAWFPDAVRVMLYNELSGMREEITLPKKFVAIVENPLYTVMNEPNSTYQRLIRKLNLLDTTDDRNSSGKLDLIIQLPYVIKSEARRQQAEQRRKDIEAQLSGSQYGIAYTDGTEKVTQLNRAVESKLLDEVKYFTDMLFNQLGLTPDVMNGTADEAAMNNYFFRTIDPILDAISEAMRRAFLTKTARTQGQSVEWYRNPFKLVAMEQLAEIGDKFVRNRIATGNDIRTAIGWKPAKDPSADKLTNPNMPTDKQLGPARQPLAIEPAPSESPPQLIETGGNRQNGT